MSLRTRAIKLASELPQGSDERKALLKVLASAKTAAADPAVDREIKVFAQEVQKLKDENTKKSYPGLWEKAQEMGEAHYSEVGIDWGRKYARIWYFQGPSKTSRSVHCFVNRENGDIMKSASWKKPAKHPRGNVMDRAGRMRSVGEYGARYLR